MNKRACVLQVTPSEPNEEHIRLFRNKKDCDFYFVTHDKEHSDALKFCPNTTWTDTRNILAAGVPKQYDYYAFVDYDFTFEPHGELNALEQILEDLEKFEPAVLTYYPGPRFHTPFNKDKEYFDKHEYSVIPFTHCGMKVVHHSLMKWFFPMITRFEGGMNSCHMFNIQEIPFLRNVICSHKMTYDNSVNDMNAPHNKDASWSKYRMDQMWEWMAPAFKKIDLLKNYQTNWNLSGDPRHCLDSLHIKRVFLKVILDNELKPAVSPKNINYYDEERLSNFFDMNHEHFNNKKFSIAKQSEQISENFKSNIEEILRETVSFGTLKSRANPWYGIVADINNKLSDRRNITINECVEIFQQMKNNEAVFYKNSKPDPLLEEYLAGKRVAFVGPAPYLIGKNRGPEIDSYDVVVRTQPEIFCEEDYGSRTDIIQSCMNSSYSPKILRYLESNPPETYPKFIISNNTVSRESHPGGKIWTDVVHEYETYLKKFGVPFAHLKQPDGTFDRWALYWEIYAKKHIEKLDDNVYTVYSANLNSGYGAYSMLLRHSIKELAVFGMDFYNFGEYSRIEDKYKPEYIKQQGQEGTYLGPDVMVHDIMSQVMHCRNILLADPRFRYDKEPLEKILSERMNQRLRVFKHLPRMATHDTE